MTYDLCGYRMLPGELLEETFARLDAARDVAPHPAEWEATLALGERIAALLSTALVQRHNIDTEGRVELATAYYHVSLTPGETEISMPYWNTGSDLDWHQIDAVLDLMRSAGFTIYNPQNGEQVPSGFHAHGDDYATNHAVVQPRLQELAADEAQPRGGRWRRLLGRPSR